MKMSKKKILIILIGILLLIPTTITLSKFIYDFAKDYIMEANHFYFNSDKLEEDGITYALNNWSGVSNFTIQFDLNNSKNNDLFSNSDITYNIEINCDNDVICNLSSNSGTIYRDEKTDKFSLTIIPTRVFDTNESVSVDIYATSTAPYIKTLSATFVITVGRKGVGFEIADTANQPYLNFIVTNALDEYVAIRDNGTYHTGDVILTDDYINLSDSEKENFASALITLTFDPRVVFLDTTNNIMDNATFDYTTIDGVDYISSITFKVDATSSIELGFYKKIYSMDYSYPDVASESIIQFNVMN